MEIEPGLIAAFETIPHLQNHSPGAFKIDRLEGYTNQNYRLRNHRNDWVLRIPKVETNRMIDRPAEIINSGIAVKLGLAPDCVWRDARGLSLSNTLKDSRALQISDFDQAANMYLLISKVRKLHDSAAPFCGLVDLEKLLSRYFSLATQTIQYRRHRHAIESCYRQATAKIQRLNFPDQPLVPSHNDLVLENLLLDPSHRLWIIDWEYAAMASPYWDLATIANAAEFSVEQCQVMLQCYSIDRARLSMELLNEYRYVLRLLSICWLAAFSTTDISDEIEKLRDINA